MATPIEKWVEEQAKIMQPEKIHWCDGSEDEARRLIEIGLHKEKIDGRPVFYELNHGLWPHSYLHRSHPMDVARTENLTFVCHPDKETSGPNNNWMRPEDAKRLLFNLTKGCMKGRTMYVIPYMMGNPFSPLSKPCIQITDSSYVAVNMRIMARMGREVLEKIGDSDDFFRGIHSIGDLDPERRFIMHFPEENLVWSIGSGYGGNALLGKKCFSLRIASWIGLKEGWLAEHMAIIGIEDPEGNIFYVTIAMPSACGKTNLAMLESQIPGYRVWTLGDDIAWLKFGNDGRLYAINPETGLFGVAPGTSMKTNPNIIKALKSDKTFPTLFTNTALHVERNEPWWEGLSDPPSSGILDWQGRPWDPSMNTKASHPNARFTVSIYNCPNLSSQFENPQGVPISAIIFGSRRSRIIPLIVEAFDWEHGVFLGARIGSETTSAAALKEGVVRRDPMSMLPFCGYNLADYFRHWLEIGKRLAHPPRVFSVNWFRVDEEGNFIWPGFSENMRVLKWIVERIKGRVGAIETPIGLMPIPDELDLDGLALPSERIRRLFQIDPEEWEWELNEIKGFFDRFGERMPPEMWQMYDEMKRRIKNA